MDTPETTDQIMRQAGFVSAADAAKAVGLSHPSNIHKMVNKGKLKGQRAGVHLYVSVASLLEAYKEAEPIVARIKALGVAPKEAPSTVSVKGGRRERRGA